LWCFPGLDCSFDTSFCEFSQFKVCPSHGHISLFINPSIRYTVVPVFCVPEHVPGVFFHFCLSFTVSLRCIPSPLRDDTGSVFPDILSWCVYPVKTFMVLLPASVPYAFLYTPPLLSASSPGAPVRFVGIVCVPPCTFLLM